jgi:hypothetical protein
MVRFISDRLILPFACRVHDAIRFRDRYTLLDELRARTARECADYAEKHMAGALSFSSREALWDHAAGRIAFEGIAAEFGVGDGHSIRYLARKIRGPIHGFDSFHGLPEDWEGSEAFARGTFGRGGRPPKVPANVRLITGEFRAALPAFLESNPGVFSFVHFDCDTYRSTSEILDLIAPRLAPGSVLVFDEYFGYRGWKLGEWKAWREQADRRGFAYEYFGFSSQQAALRILRAG